MTFRDMFISEIVLLQFQENKSDTNMLCSSCDFEVIWPLQILTISCTKALQTANVCNCIGKSMEFINFNEIYEFLWIPANPSGVQWSPVKSDKLVLVLMSASGCRRLLRTRYCQQMWQIIFVMCVLPLRLAAGAFSPVKIVQLQ